MPHQLNAVDLSRHMNIGEKHVNAHGMRFKKPQGFQTMFSLDHLKPGVRNGFGCKHPDRRFILYNEDGGYFGQAWLRHYINPL